MKIAWALLVMACMLVLQSEAADAAPTIRSASKLAFADARTLFVADWKGARIYALTVPEPRAPLAKPFNLKDVQEPIARALHVPRADLEFEDMAVQPGSELAYIAVSVQSGRSAALPAIVTVDALGRVRVLHLASLAATSVAISDGPSPDLHFWRTIPAQSLTITDMKFYQGKLYVAGLSDRTFASTLRVYDFPFDGAEHATTVQMYHPVHNQIETRAPIRAMAIMTLNGEPTLVAAYTCTPLVTIPLSELKDGAHVSGRTIAELGWGNRPIDLVTFNYGGIDYALIANSSRAGDLLTVSAIARGADLPAITTPINWPTEPYKGVRAVMVPLSEVDWLDNLNKDLLLALRRDAPSGNMGLVTIPKGVYLRLSDFINEYDFPDYQYPPTDPFHAFHKIARGLEGYPELVR